MVNNIREISVKKLGNYRDMKDLYDRSFYGEGTTSVLADTFDILHGHTEVFP